MEENYFLTSSITYAMKGQELLRRRGIRSYVVRDRELNSRGCGYAILARGPRWEAEAALSAGKVKILGVKEAGRE